MKQPQGPGLLLRSRAKIFHETISPKSHSKCSTVHTRFFFHISYLLLASSISFFFFFFLKDNLIYNLEHKSAYIFIIFIIVLKWSYRIQARLFKGFNELEIMYLMSKRKLLKLLSLLFKILL